MQFLKKNKIYENIEPNANLCIKGISNVIIKGTLGDKATISITGVADVDIEATLGEQVKVFISGIINLNFKYQPPASTEIKTSDLSKYKTPTTLRQGCQRAENSLMGNVTSEVEDTFRRLTHKSSSKPIPIDNRLSSPINRATKMCSIPEIDQLRAIPFEYDLIKNRPNLPSSEFFPSFPSLSPFSQKRNYNSDSD